MGRLYNVTELQRMRFPTFSRVEIQAGLRECQIESTIIDGELLYSLKPNSARRVARTAESIYIPVSFGMPSYTIHQFFKDFGPKMYEYRGQYYFLFEKENYKLIEKKEKALHRLIDRKIREASKWQE